MLLGVSLMPDHRVCVRVCVCVVCVHVCVSPSVATGRKFHDSRKNLMFRSYLTKFNRWIS